MNEYKKIYLHYENCLEKFGSTHKGVDWPNKIDADNRYKVMLDIIKYGNIKSDTPSFRFWSWLCAFK